VSNNAAPEGFVAGGAVAGVRVGHPGGRLQAQQVAFPLQHRLQVHVQRRSAGHLATAYIAVVANAGQKSCVQTPRQLGAKALASLQSTPLQPCSSRRQ